MTALDHWDYDLPPDRIADRPAPRRAASRLMVLPLDGGPAGHRAFSDLPDLLRPGDLLVANDTRVMAARLHARRATGGQVELLLLAPGPGRVPALARPARKLNPGDVLDLEGGGRATVHARDGGTVVVSFDRPPERVMADHGEMPLPPYLHRPADARDAERYQTVYAGPLGAAAAPTAGLHFTWELIERLEAHGIQFTTVTLHVGLGTFLPLRDEDLATGTLHEERYAVPPETADAVRRADRVIAVGTTSARTLESATHDGHLAVGEGTTDLFIRPGYRFRAIDGLITNFHLPRSSLLMLVGALAGRDRILAAYAEAVERGYRFYSYGDAMLLL